MLDYFDTEVAAAHITTTVRRALRFRQPVDWPPAISVRTPHKPHLAHGAAHALTRIGLMLVGQPVLAPSTPQNPTYYSLISLGTLTPNTPRPRL